MTDDEEITRLRRENDALRAAVREAQWAGEGGYREESACPFCGASPYIGQPPFHEAGCIVAHNEAPALIATWLPHEPRIVYRGYEMPTEIAWNTLLATSLREQAYGHGWFDPELVVRLPLY